ncbi:MAG: acyl-CoA thioesterase [Helicobacter sp.]|nr:acyl-CoA thioesterase [Helicobacter sp.]
MLKRSYNFRAEFFDVDSMGVVWHGNYVKYTEMARCRLLDELGCNYIKMKQKKFALPIVKMDFKFIKPIYFNDEIRIEIVLLDCNTFLKFSYQIFNSNEELLCKANTSQVAVSLQGETLYEIPKILKEILVCNT